ncbi:IS110 family transposase [Paracoccus aerius]|uniref:IS110 family transposase n=1 Tax=Paracoccus aerius TaxID=1915382 RepID=A0ABS1SBU1_9RHOB|nr:IS110 family transposase [Paracoccus aerius]MBL3675564.1 IS110 family transposase [Paracoccus aerius]GHG35233.1 IS110 family transposase [Paracoccus aerius]
MCAKKQGSLEDLAIIGVDIGKDVFHLVGFDRSGQVVLRRKIKRFALQDTFAALPRCIVGMEACLSAHFVSRTLRHLGFEPRIIPAIYVKPFNKGQKNDYNDAEAIAEAAVRPNLQCVTEKNQDQLDLQALHRVRARLVSRRTATINQIRAFLIEQGITVRSGLRALDNSFEAILEQRKDEMSPRMRRVLTGLRYDWHWLDGRIDQVSEEIKEVSRSEENCARIMSIPGVGPMISTAMVAAIGKGEAFDRGRDFAAWVGLVPQQFSTGGRTILGRITKRGSRYLRMLLVQAARIIMMRPHLWPNFSFGNWLAGAVTRMPGNKAAIALANKLARIAWSILRHGTSFDAARDRDMATDAI